VSCVGVTGQVAGGGDELGAEDGADAGHRLEDLGLGVGVEGVTDPRVQGADALVELE